MVAQVGVVGCNHKERILIPRHGFRLVEELPQGIVGIANTFVDDDTFLRKNLLILIRYDIRMMGRGCKESRHERLPHLAHFCGVKLHERLVPNCPCAVEVLVTAKTLVCIIFCTTEIIRKTCGASKSLKAHRTILGSVEEGRIIALLLQFASQSAHIVHRGWRQEEWFHKHWNARQDTGHSVDALSTIAI